MLKSPINVEGMNITINTTEDCNLACTYCYEINKTKKCVKREDAKKFIDLIIENDDPLGLKDSKSATVESFYDGSITFDFIGGDSLMDVDTLDDLMGYFIKKINTTNSKNAKRWRNSYKFSLSSNGTLFSLPKVRAFCEKWKRVLSIGVSIDGCPEIHDLNRVFPDGSPSMPKILENWEWYQKTFPHESRVTKATCAKSSIPFLSKSLKFMHEELGIKYINQNFIMENMYLEQSDLDELDKQLELCVDYVFEHRDEMYWSMLDADIFALAHRNPEEEWNTRGQCGSGCMPTLGIDGNIYPCFRFLPHTLEKGRELLIVGNVKEGINNTNNFERVRIGAIRNNCTKEAKCRECQIESACAYCIGGCWSEFGEFRRTTHICEATKLLVKWSRVYWTKIAELKGQTLEECIEPIHPLGEIPV